MAGKHLNEKRFSEMKDVFLAESTKLGSEGSAAPVSEQSVRERINLMQVSNLDDYHKVFLNLEQQLDKDKIRLVIVDNILTVCDYFIKADGTVDWIERSAFLVNHSRKLKRIAYHHNMVIIILNNVIADMENTAA